MSDRTCPRCCRGAKLGRALTTSHLADISADKQRGTHEAGTVDTRRMSVKGFSESTPPAEAKMKPTKHSAIICARQSLRGAREQKCIRQEGERQTAPPLSAGRFCLQRVSESMADLPRRVSYKHRRHRWRGAGQRCRPRGRAPPRAACRATQASKEERALVRRCSRRPAPHEQPSDGRGQPRAARHAHEQLAPAEHRPAARSTRRALIEQRRPSPVAQPPPRLFVHHIAHHSDALETGQHRDACQAPRSEG